MSEQYNINNLELDELGALYKQSNEEKNAQRLAKYHTDSDYEDFMKKQGLEVLQAALDHIDPANLPYEDFIKLGGAIYNEYGSIEGFRIWDAIGQKDRARYKGSLQKYWKSIKGAGKHGPAGRGTIFDIAKKQGWKWPDPHQFGYEKKQETPKKPAPQISSSKNPEMKVKLYIDSVGYSEKPKAYEIRKRCEKYPMPDPQEVTLQEFCKAVANGKTFYPTVFRKKFVGNDENGKPKYDNLAISQQIFVVDIDNEEITDGAKHCISNPLTIESALKICDAAGISPFFTYETFSSKQHRENPAVPYTKFRLCFALNEPMTAQEYGERGLQAARSWFISLFGPAADTSITDSARMIYGTDEKDSARFTARIIDKKQLEAVIFAPAPMDPPKEEQPAPVTESGESDIDNFFDVVSTDRYKAISTGISALDKRLAGGFINQWIVIINAAPGAGKTVLATQICENMARSGRKCLYFNFEMSKEQLIARSLARSLSRDDIGAIDILRLYKQPEEVQQAVFYAGMEYKQRLAPKMLYNPDATGPDLDKIITVMEAHATQAEAKNEAAPIVCIDYLQMIEGREREDIKETIKRAVYCFKKYATQHNSIVICISAQSRAANNGDEARQDAGRDTSNIEYGADLQLQIMTDKDNEEIRQLYVTKSRFAAPSLKHHIDFDFLGKQGIFMYRGEGETGGKKAGQKFKR